MQNFHSFQIKNKIKKAVLFGNGHIHDTFHLVSQTVEDEDYLLQRINHVIFKKVGEMMNNIAQVTTHLHQKNKIPTLTLISTHEDEYFYQDDNGDYWRMYLFMKNWQSYDVPENTAQIYEGAKAFGSFLRQLSDFPAQSLFPVLPDFHNIITRLNALKKAAEKDVKKRKKEVAKSLKWIWEMADEMCTIENLRLKGKLPLRVTHNDTKFNNVLFHQTSKATMVVDLDTVMPGVVHYDFGDGIRTAVSTAAEDEADLIKIQVDMERYQAFASGYLEATKDILTPLELKYLPLSGALLAYIMGVRFLTDYLEGDVYYKIHFEKHNLQRALAQLTLSKRLMERKTDFL